MKTISIHFFFLIMSLGLGILFPALGQESDFSMYQYTTVLTNPGMEAGEEQIQVGVNYRHQFLEVGKDIRTSLLTVTCPIRYNENRLVVVTSFLDDESANQLVTTGGLLGVAYGVRLNARSTLNLGMQVGFFQRKAGGRFTTEEQFVNGVFDPNIPSSDAVLGNRVNYPTLSQGLYWEIKDREGRDQAFIGVSTFNSSRPNVSMTREKDRLPLTLKTMAGYSFYPDMRFSISPTVRWVHAAGNNQLNIGSRVAYLLDPGSSKQVGMGLWYDTNRLAVVSLEYRSEAYTIAASSDIPLSGTLSSVQRGIMELALYYRFKNEGITIAPKQRSGKTKTPKMKDQWKIQKRNRKE